MKHWQKLQHTRISRYGKYHQTRSESPFPPSKLSPISPLGSSITNHDFLPLPGTWLGGELQVPTISSTGWEAPRPRQVIHFWPLGWFVLLIHPQWVGSEKWRGPSTASVCWRCWIWIATLQLRSNSWDEWHQRNTRFRISRPPASSDIFGLETLKKPNATFLHRNHQVSTATGSCQPCKQRLCAVGDSCAHLKFNHHFFRSKFKGVAFYIRGVPWKAFLPNRGHMLGGSWL